VNDFYSVNDTVDIFQVRFQVDFSAKGITEAISPDRLREIIR
jgi:hypothetical protein